MYILITHYALLLIFKGVRKMKPSLLIIELALKGGAIRSTYTLIKWLYITHICENQTWAF